MSTTRFTGQFISTKKQTGITYDKQYFTNFYFLFLTGNEAQSPGGDIRGFEQGFEPALLRNQVDHQTTWLTTRPQIFN